jgi:hypothetical protein
MTREAVRAGTLSAIAFGGAIGCAAILTLFDGIPPIVPAFAAGCVLAAIEWQLDIPSPHANVDLTGETLMSWLVAFVLAFAMLAVVALVVPVGAQFVCEPLVPWRISIAIFGAFFSAWIVAAMSVRPSDRRYQPLVRLMLFWIAPFYGFFHAPWFLAQTLVVPCTNRPLAQALIATAVMALTTAAGARVGAWMFDRPL